MIAKPIKNASDQNQKEADSFLLSFEEDRNQVSIYFSDELELEPLSNEVDDDDFLRDEGPNKTSWAKKSVPSEEGTKKRQPATPLSSRFLSNPTKTATDRKRVWMRLGSSSAAIGKRSKRCLSVSDNRPLTSKTCHRG